MFRNDERPSFGKTISLEQLSEKQIQGTLVLLGVRLKEDFEKDSTLTPGATYVDPEDLPNWASTLNSDSEAEVYCMARKWEVKKSHFF
ncbi:MAG: hypothetical protein JKY29_12505 [Gammaproteobacteria bacterium]|nr:hypothetical protein [Gammaproteobacteria bacterium]